MRSQTSRPRCWASCPAVQSSRTRRDRKSTRLNSSHANISYAVFCLKKKKTSSGSTLGQLPASDLFLLFHSTTGERLGRKLYAVFGWRTRGCAYSYIRLVLYVISFT